MSNKGNNTIAYAHQSCERKLAGGGGGEDHARRASTYVAGGNAPGKHVLHMCCALKGHDILTYCQSSMSNPFGVHTFLGTAYRECCPRLHMSTPSGRDTVPQPKAGKP